VALQGVGQDLADRMRRVERGEGVLVDDLQGATVFRPIPAAQGADRAPPVEHLAAGRLQQADHDPPGGRLAAAAFPDQAEDLVLGHGQVDVLQDGDARPPLAEGAIYAL